MKGRLKREVLQMVLLPVGVLAIFGVFAAQRLPNNISLEKVTIHPAAGEKWSFDRTVVTFAGAGDKISHDGWKESARIDVTFQHDTWNLWKSFFWRTHEIEILDSRGSLVSGALDIKGPAEIDEKGRYIHYEEAPPRALSQRYVMQYWLKVPKSYSPKGNLTFRTQISHGSGLTLPIVVTIPKSSQ